MSGSPCRTASRALCRVTSSPACRRTTRSWKPTGARPPGYWPNAPGSRPRVSAVKGADWDEMRALDLPAQAVEAALLALVPESGTGRLLDIGTGTGRVLELLAPRVSQGIGVDASKAMLALARSRLARSGLAHCSVRLADMYRLPLAEASFDLAVMQMVLHYAEDPTGRIGRGCPRAAPGRSPDCHRPRAS